MKHYLVVVECAIECDGKFLIIRRPNDKHAGGLLSFAGGKVDECDEVHEYDILGNAIKREIFEELGIHLDGPLKYVTSQYFLDGKDINVVDVIFYHHFERMPNVVPNPREVPWYAWMTPDEINQADNAADWLKRYIALIIDMNNNLKN